MREGNIPIRIKKVDAVKAPEDWNWTRIAVLAVAVLLILAVLLTLVFAFIPPYAASGDVPP